MSRKISRKPSSAGKIVARQKQANRVRNARARTGSAFDAVMDWLPFGEEAMHRIFLFVILGLAAVLAITVARVAGVPELAGKQFGLIAKNTGFSVERVEVRGVKHLNELKIYERVEPDMHKPMSEVDVDSIRATLTSQLSWVQDARVSRQLPDQLVIDVVERTPVAVLRRGEQLVLIDGEGKELDPVTPEKAKGKLVVTGPGAGKQVAALGKLLEAAPALKPQVAEAEWVGNRRWNLSFKTGQVLALPEGDQQSANALMSFARLDGVNRLLGGKASAFDMRAPDRIYFRVPKREADEAAAKVAENAEKLAAKSDGDKEAGPKREEAAAPEKAEKKPASKKAETKPKAKPRAREDG